MRGDRWPLQLELFSSAGGQSASHKQGQQQSTLGQRSGPAACSSAVCRSTGNSSAEGGGSMHQ